jgi:MATE family multidrug resistance protein
MQVQAEPWAGRMQRVLGLAWPLILSSTSTMVMQFADALFLGQWSAYSLAAVTPAGIWAFLLMALFLGPVQYVSSFIAQSRGAQKDQIGDRFAWQSIWLALAFGVLLGWATPLAVQVFEWAGHSEALVREEVAYASVLLRFSWISFLNQAFTAIFIGRGKTRVVGGLQLISMLVNVLLDWLLIFGHWGFPALGMEGAAIGTVAATAVPPLVQAILFWRSRKGQSIVWPDLLLLRRLCRFGFAEGMRLFSDVGIWTAFVFVVGRIGAEPLTANNMVFRITSLVWLPLQGLGKATGQLCGVAIGAQQAHEARRTVKAGAALGVLWAIVWGIPMLWIPHHFLGWFPIEATAAYASRVTESGVIILMIAALLGLFDAINMVLQGGLLGAGDARWTMRMLTGVHSLMLLAMVWGDQIGMSVGTVWWIACVDQIVLSVALARRFLSSRWLEHNLIQGIEDPVLPVPVESAPAGTEPSPD